MITNILKGIQFGFAMLGTWASAVGAAGYFANPEPAGCQGTCVNTMQTCYPPAPNPPQQNASWCTGNNCS